MSIPPGALPQPSEKRWESSDNSAFKPYQKSPKVIYNNFVSGSKSSPSQAQSADASAQSLKGRSTQLNAPSKAASPKRNLSPDQESQDT